MTTIELVLAAFVVACFMAGISPLRDSGLGEEARERKCLSNIKQINVAILSYAQDYDEALPGARGTEWNTALYEYMRDPQEVLKCPEQRSNYGLLQRKFQKGLF